LSYVWRETLELQRDPVRATLAFAGSVLLMLVIGFGMTTDVNSLRYAVLDRDQTVLSQSYNLDISGSNYFIERRPIRDYDDLDRRMRSGELAVALEIPPGFGRDLRAGRQVAVAAWIDGAMPQRAETVQGYIRALHQHWLTQLANRQSSVASTSGVSVENRFRYNPEVRSLPAMVPTVIPLLLLMLPAMLAALAVEREKETGSIINLYVTPVTRTEFMLGKQLPYVALAMANFVLMVLMAIFIFGVPVRGDFFALSVAALLFCFASTGLGLLASAVTKSQIAALFLALIGTMIPATVFGGMTDPVSSLEGAARVIGQVYPASHMFTISRGVFNKALGFRELGASFLALAIVAPVIVGFAISLVRKQER